MELGALLVKLEGVSIVTTRILEEAAQEVFQDAEEPSHDLSFIVGESLDVAVLDLVGFELCKAAPCKSHL